MQGNEERRLPDMLQHLPLRARVLGCLRLLHDGGLLQHLHGVQLARVVAAHLAHQEHFPVRCSKKRMKSEWTEVEDREHKRERRSRSAGTHLPYPEPSAARNSRSLHVPRDPSGWLERATDAGYITKHSLRLVHVGQACCMLSRNCLVSHLPRYLF